MPLRELWCLQMLVPSSAIDDLSLKRVHALGVCNDHVFSKVLDSSMLAQLQQVSSV